VRKSRKPTFITAKAFRADKLDAEAGLPEYQMPGSTAQRRNLRLPRKLFVTANEAARAMGLDASYFISTYLKPGPNGEPPILPSYYFPTMAVRKNKDTMRPLIRRVATEDIRTYMLQTLALQGLEHDKLAGLRRKNASRKHKPASPYTAPLDPDALQDEYEKLIEKFSVDTTDTE
jgi:hypothetical protein